MPINLEKYYKVSFKKFYYKNCNSFGSSYSAHIFCRSEKFKENQTIGYETIDKITLIIDEENETTNETQW